MRTALPLLVLCALGSGCGPSGSYTLSWFVAGETRADAFGCASHGIDGLMVEALHASTMQPAGVVVFPCGPHFGEHTIGGGDYLLQITPLNARGERITDPRTGLPVTPVEAQVSVPGGGTANVGPVTITPNPACSDGVDNDGDGLIDLADPDCQSALGDSEAPPPTN